MSRDSFAKLSLLNAEEMGQDLARLQEREQQLDQEKAAIAKNKTQLADEFLIKARRQIITDDETDWFERACQYFETSLTAARTLTSLFESRLGTFPAPWGVKTGAVVRSEGKIP